MLQHAHIQWININPARIAAAPLLAAHHRRCQTPRTGPPAAAANSSNDSTSPPAYMLHPAIAQREALRQFYHCYSGEEAVEIVLNTHQHLDKPTSLKFMCHLATCCLKGQLQGDAAAQDRAARAVFETFTPDDLRSFSPAELGALLWALSCVPAAREALWTTDLLESAAKKETAGGGGDGERYDAYSIKDVVNVVFAIAQLSPRHMPMPEATLRYASGLVGSLAQRMESQHGADYMRASFAPGDFADLMVACAHIYAMPDGSPAALPPPSAKLLDSIAAEVRRQLANRSSVQASFMPRDLARFLQSFAALRYRSPAVSGMLDGVAGFVAGRVRSSHLNGVTRPHDLSLVLSAFAALGHCSVSVPELLTAAGEQLRRNAVEEHEAHLLSLSASDAFSAASPAWVPPKWFPLDCATLVSILNSHVQLGFAPDPLTLQTLLPGLCRREIFSCSGADAAALLELLDVFEFSPGAELLEIMLERVAAEKEV